MAGLITNRKLPLDVCIKFVTLDRHRSLANKNAPFRNARVVLRATPTSKHVFSRLQL